MSVKAILAALLFAVAGTPVLADEAGFLVSLKIDRNGETISSPRLWSEYGKDVAAQIGESFRIELNSRDLGTSADIKISVYTNESGSLKLVSAPRIHAKLDAESAIQLTGEDGVTYRITITPVKTARPT